MLNSGDSRAAEGLGLGVWGASECLGVWTCANAARRSACTRCDPPSVISFSKSIKVSSLLELGLILGMISLKLSTRWSTYPHSDSVEAATRRSSCPAPSMQINKVTFKWKILNLRPPKTVLGTIQDAHVVHCQTEHGPGVAKWWAAPLGGGQLAPRPRPKKANGLLGEQ